jgi:hypothetical protein
MLPIASSESIFLFIQDIAHIYVCFVCLDSVKQTEKGVDIIASLCHNYHTSEKRLKEMMGKSHEAIEDFFGMKALSASKCKTENLDKIDTGMEPPFSFACYRVRACILNCCYSHILIS